MTASYQQFIASGGYFQMPLSLLRIQGEKAAVFLHGQFTNHIKGLQNGQTNYNLLLTQKGKVAADLYVARQKEDFLLLIEKSFKEKILDHLGKLAPLSRVTLSDETDHYLFFHVCSLNSIDSLREGEPFVYHTDRLGIQGYDFIVSKEKKQILIKHLEELKFVQMDQDLQETIRVEQGICKVGLDATEANLPQEVRLERALHFDKGCYLGQEVIARIHYRGHLNKKLVGLKLVGLKIEGGVGVYDQDEKVGMITSCVFSPKIASPLALGFVPYEDSNKVGKKFKIGKEGIEALLIDLPLLS